MDVSTECAGGGTCQHHDAAIVDFVSTVDIAQEFIYRTSFADDATIVQVEITTTKRCCIVVNATIVSISPVALWMYEIERPLNTVVTAQESFASMGTPQLVHYAAWEALDAGTYTYYLVNRGGAAKDISGAWISAIASDCDG